MILNKTDGETYDLKVIFADTFFKRLKGLMFKKDIDFALVFADFMDSSIHTHFMRFEIDVYFLDEKKTVFEKACLKPWRFYRPKKQAKYILEVKKDRLKLKKGDKLDFI